MELIAISHHPPTQRLFKQAKSERGSMCLLASPWRCSSVGIPSGTSQPGTGEWILDGWRSIVRDYSWGKRLDGD